MVKHCLLGIQVSDNLAHSKHSQEPKHNNGLQAVNVGVTHIEGHILCFLKSAQATLSLFTLGFPAVQMNVVIRFPSPKTKSIQ
jgi:hypothetical protein